MNSQKLITNKSNALTEAKTGELRLFDDKMINILYYLIENSKDNLLKLNLLDVKKLLGIKSNDYIELILGSLERLDNKKISLRNINYKGRDIDWIRSSVIKEMILFSDSRSNLQVEISRALIEGLKQKSNFTPLDINICNKFQTKYGLKLYELYKRYENFPTNHHLLQKENESCFLISIDDATQRFGNNFKYASKWKEAFIRGLSEIKQITNTDVNMFYIKQEKVFIFFWKRNNTTLNFQIFKKTIRKNYINKTICSFTQEDGKTIELSVGTTGKLYNKLDTTPISAKKAEIFWKWLYQNQSKWRKENG